MKKWGHWDARLPAKVHTKRKEQAQDGHNTHIFCTSRRYAECASGHLDCLQAQKRGVVVLPPKRGAECLGHLINTLNLNILRALQKWPAPKNNKPSRVCGNQNSSKCWQKWARPPLCRQGRNTTCTVQHYTVLESHESPCRHPGTTAESVPLAAAEVLSSALMPAQSRPQGFGTCCIPPRSLRLPVYSSHPSLIAF